MTAEERNARASAPPERLSEAEKVYRWRSEQIKAACKALEADDVMRLAMTDRCLHQVVGALRAGCAPTTALQIFL